jgi:hypothetical protein
VDHTQEIIKIFFSLFFSFFLFTWWRSWISIFIYTNCLIISWYTTTHDIYLNLWDWLLNLQQQNLEFFLSSKYFFFSSFRVTLVFCIWEISIHWILFFHIFRYFLRSRCTKLVEIVTKFMFVEVIIQLIVELMVYFNSFIELKK